MYVAEAAEASGLTVKAIHYYEEIGLVRAGRSNSGYRVFADQDLHKLRFVSRARRLGFSIDDCRHLLSLYEDKRRASADVKALAQARIAEVDKRIAELQGLRSTLAQLADACRGDDRPDCPILDDLSADGG